MKTIFNKIINGLMLWAEIIAEYRQSKYAKYYN
jgi:hypothetical protein